MHTVYIVDPSQMFTRYATAFASTARMREGAQAGFLVLARLAYLAFGAVPGFFVTRYLFALIAIVPAYLLLRRLYGIPAGAVAIVILLSSPVIITAWGTDYPDSAVVSYVVGAVACLAMPCRTRWRVAWLAAAGVLMTLAAWSHGMGIVLVVTTAVVYAGVRYARERQSLLRDGAFMVGVFVSTTAILMGASAAVLGQLDFIRPTFAAAAFLNQPSQTALWHTNDRRWVLHVPYLLVPPSVVVTFAATLGRRLRAIATPLLFVGVTCAAQFAVFVYLQFFNHVETLEMHYFSSTLWGVVCLALAITLAEISRPLEARRIARWLPAAVLLVVPLAYEADPHVPSFQWLPVGALLALVPVALATIVNGVNRRRAAHSASRAVPVLSVAIALIGIMGSLLVLTVSPWVNTLTLDPTPQYAGALGGSATYLIDEYRVSAAIPSFVGNPTYQGEQLLMWCPAGEIGPLMEEIGMFHAGFNLLPTGLPAFSAVDAAVLSTRRPAELLLLGTESTGFAQALTALGPYRPTLVRTTVLRQGPVTVHLWLIFLKVFAERTAQP
jgi:hypothetical protein